MSQQNQMHFSIGKQLTVHCGKLSTKNVTASQMGLLKTKQEGTGQRTHVQSENGFRWKCAV